MDYGTTDYSQPMTLNSFADGNIGSLGMTLAPKYRYVNLKTLTPFPKEPKNDFNQRPPRNSMPMSTNIGNAERGFDLYRVMQLDRVIMKDRSGEFLPPQLSYFKRAPPLYPIHDPKAYNVNLRVPPLQLFHQKFCPGWETKMKRI